MRTWRTRPADIARCGRRSTTSTGVTYRFGETHGSRHGRRRADELPQTDGGFIQVSLSA
jgi:hypothetical protein